MSPEEQERLFRAALLAMIKIRVTQDGADVLDVLDEIPPAIHADVVEGLVRLGLLHDA
jgi:hypothetical protein